MASAARSPGAQGSDTPAQDNRPVLGIAAALTVVFIWSGWLIVTKVGAESTLSIFDIAALRFGLTGLVSLPIVLYFKPWVGLPLHRIAVLATLAGVPYVLLSFTAFTFAPAAYGGVFMNGILPALTLALGWLWLKERPRPWQIAGAALIIGGASLAAIDASASAVPGAWIGALLFVTAACVFSVYLILNRLWGVTALQLLLSISVVNAYAPLVHLGALESVVEQLGLKLIRVVAEPYAVARSIAGEQLGQSGALFVDVGGGTTDVALVRSGTVEGTRMFALGGRAFTKSLADRLDIAFEEAERFKIAHAGGRELEDADEVAQIIGEDIAVWAAGVELVLEEFGQEGLLPGRIELCGGGAALPEVRAALEAADFASGLPFARRPQISMMEPDSVSEIDDATGLLVDQQDVTPMALAFQAVEAAGPQEPLDAALARVLTGMRI